MFKRVAAPQLYRRQEAAGWLASYNLQEGFVSFVGFVTIISVKILRGVVLDVRGFIVARLPHISAVAVRDGVDNPTCDVLCRRVEVQDLVDIGMVNLAVNQAFDLGEIAHHAITVELFGAAIDVNLPVVAVQVLALALIVEVKLMACGYF